MKFEIENEETKAELGDFVKWGDDIYMITKDYLGFYTVVDLKRMVVKGCNYDTIVELLNGQFQNKIYAIIKNDDVTLVANKR